MWVDMILNPLCNLELWPWIFNVKFHGQILKDLYPWSVVANWYGLKDKWVDSKSDTLCLSTLTSPVTLTLDFQGQIFKKLYLRSGEVSWYGMKGDWVYRMLNSLCDLELWSWPCTSKVKLWNKRISRIEWNWLGTKGMSGFLDPFNLTHVLRLDFQGQILKWSYLKNGRVNWLGTKGMWIWEDVRPAVQLWTWNMGRHVGYSTY